MLKNIWTKKILISLTVLLFIIAVILPFLFKKSSALDNETKQPVVKVKPLSYYVTEKTFTTYGSIVSPNSVDLRAQQPSMINAIDFEPGQKVKKGEVLFELTTNDTDNPFQKLKAKMAQSKSWYQRMMKMSKEDPESVSKFDLLKAKLQYKQDLAAYEKAGSIENVQAPINGVISDTLLSVGDFVDAGSKLAEIVAPDSLQVRYEILSKYTDKVKVGQKIYFYPDDSKKVYHGEVSYVAPLLNQQNYALTLRANLHDTSQLPLNSFGKVVQVIQPHYKILAIPQNIVQTDEQGFYLYIVSGDTVRKRYFQPGEVTEKGLMQIRAGISSKTLIITSDLSRLNPGQRVVPSAS